MRGVIEIPATELGPGMQVMKHDGRNWVKDVKLGARFTTSIRFPSLAFDVADRGGLRAGEHRCVVFSRCAKVAIQILWPLGRTSVKRVCAGITTNAKVAKNATAVATITERTSHE
jgi:hypothetical protein